MLLIRNPFSHTKKFFQKTLHSFRSLFTCDTYQKLPKSAPCCDGPFPYTTSNDHDELNIAPGPEVAENFQELDKFYSDFTKWDAVNNKVKGKRRHKKKEDNQLWQIQEVQRSDDDRILYKSSDTGRSLVSTRNTRREDSCSTSKREAKSVLVAEKLKELERMNVGDVDQVLDIEEVIHYYSRLTCPAYVEIIDKFFMDMYAEFVGQRNSPAGRPATVSVGSRPKFLSMRK